LAQFRTTVDFDCYYFRNLANETRCRRLEKRRCKPYNLPRNRRMMQTSELWCTNDENLNRSSDLAYKAINMHDGHYIVYRFYQIA